MSNLSFNNEIVFGAGSATDGVSGIAGTSTSKILYNAQGGGFFDTNVVTTSAVLNGTEYEIDIFAGYNGSTLAIVNKDRFSTQFVFASADNTQTETDSGYISVSPTLRRLASLGYV